MEKGNIEEKMEEIKEQFNKATERIEQLKEKRSMLKGKYIAYQEMIDEDKKDLIILIIENKEKAK